MIGRCRRVAKAEHGGWAAETVGACDLGEDRVPMPAEVTWLSFSDCLAPLPSDRRYATAKKKTRVAMKRDAGLSL